MTFSRELRTDRLLLRRWCAADREPFAALNADPRVTEHLGGAMSREESDALAARIADGFERRGFGFWALEIRGGAPFAGFVGLSVPRFEAHFTPCVEIGWRLAAAHWGHGYATEAARAALACGFGAIELKEVVAFTAPGNARSRRVMEKLGMTRDPADDFDHPLLPQGHLLRRHVLYRIARQAPAHGVALVLDPEFGDRLFALASRIHVWILDTPVNRVAVETVWRQRTGESSLENGATIFTAGPEVPPEQNAAAMIETIDLHHGEYSHEPPWSFLEVYGASPTPVVTAPLAGLGFTIVATTDEGFKVWRSAAAPGDQAGT